MIKMKPEHKGFSTQCMTPGVWNVSVVFEPNEDVEISVGCLLLYI